ncbi:hypothetical protein [Streptosporangium sp. NPDC087985]|uniref:hypothetical protein n=1 Tax=Streptosporangium sp. NPDC087985 TaxID=3366196 RepID=UPI0038020266
MVGKQTIYLLIAAAVGGGPALGIAETATADAALSPLTSFSRLQPYPPAPDFDTGDPLLSEIDPLLTGVDPLLTGIEDRAEPGITQNSRNQQVIKLNDNDWGHNGWGHGRCGGCGTCGGCRGGHRPSATAAEELPFTGAPVALIATVGAGLLAAGAAGTLISIRRRRSSSAR